MCSKCSKDAVISRKGVNYCSDHDPGPEAGNAGHPQ
jgi:hypothetical protein